MIECAKNFATLTDIIADDDKRTGAVIDWIQLQCTETVSMKLFSGGTSISLPSLHLGLQSRASIDTVNGRIQDPKCSKEMALPENFTLKARWSRVLRNQSNVVFNQRERPRSRKSNLQHDTALNAEHSISTPLSCSQVILDDREINAVAQPFTASTFIAPSTLNFVLNYGGSAMAPSIGVFHLEFNGPLQGQMSPAQSTLPGWMSIVT
ncbi:Hypothetical predicted protein [Olea europaea subsp. europaea]|uniref:Uncharacterized protein n=1 Tax=Olea europaea subsp. europaea TaxID=158383 RepID=A0A8S0RYG3_OLEEU|nr:Hypothetical predicted protein [Olea europaea subsp. europaea]